MKIYIESVRNCRAILDQVKSKDFVTLSFMFLYYFKPNLIANCSSEKMNIYIRSVGLQNFLSILDQVKSRFS